MGNSVSGQVGNYVSVKPLQVGNYVSADSLAALRLARRYIGIDINAGYHDLAYQRLDPLLTTDPDGDRP
jgi:hypothetical protein